MNTSAGLAPVCFPQSAVHRTRRILLCSGMLAALLASRAGVASLGDSVSSVEADRAHMKAATTRISPSALYTVHEMQTPEGTMVWEFVSPAGIVFAVAWKGPFLPDLRDTLGAYFNTYQAAPRAHRHGHAHRDLEQPDLVVHSGGHPRAFVGNAYVPKLVPAGVTIDQLLAQDAG